MARNRDQEFLTARDRDQGASSPTREVITISSSASPPQRGSAVSDTSDDLPLIQRRSNRSGSDDSGASGAASTGGKARSKVSWNDIQRGYTGLRCPVCGTVYQEPEEHNPFLCKHRNDNFARSEEERQWLAGFAALSRAYKQHLNGAQEELGRPGLPAAPIPNLSLLPGGNESSSNQAPSIVAPLPPRQASAIRAVQRDERQAFRAGTRDLGGVQQDIRDAAADEAAERALSSDGYSSSATSSSWHPSTSESSASSYHRSSQEILQLRRELQEQKEEVARCREIIHNTATNMQYQSRMPPATQPLHPFQYMSPFPPAGMGGIFPFHPMFGPPSFPHHGQGPAEPFNPHGPSHPFHTQGGGPPFTPLHDDRSPGDGHFDPTQRASQPQPYSYAGFTPAVNHVDQAGMFGAPELALDQLGKVLEFQKHVRMYNAYAMKAKSRGEPCLTLAQTMKKHAFAIATAFTAQIIKRLRLAPHTHRAGDVIQYTPEMVVAMPDDLFTRLYTESCSIDIEDPSQVYGILSRLEHVRQTPEEDGPLPALMRAEAAFRSKLSLLPQHAVTRCRPQELRDAFIKMVFTSANFDTIKLDFQQCQTWEQVYQQLTYRASTSSTWYATAPRHKSTPEVSVTPTVSSSSPAHVDEAASKEQSKDQSDKYWKQELARLRKEVKHDKALLLEFDTDKKKAKFLQKLKFRQVLESDIRDQVSKQMQQGQRPRGSGDARDHSRERSHTQQGYGERPSARQFSRETSTERQPYSYRPDDQRRVDGGHREDRSNAHREERSGGHGNNMRPQQSFGREQQGDQRDAQRRNDERPQQRSTTPPSDSRSRSASSAQNRNAEPPHRDRRDGSASASQARNADPLHRDRRDGSRSPAGSQGSR